MQETFNVPDVSCGHCKETIESALRSLSGVQVAVVDVDAKRVSVEYDPTVIQREQVVRVIEDAGYPVAV